MARRQGNAERNQEEDPNLAQLRDQARRERNENQDPIANGAIPEVTMMQLMLQMQQQLATQQQVIEALLANQRTPPPAQPIRPEVPAPIVRSVQYFLEWQKVKPENFVGGKDP